MLTMKFKRKYAPFPLKYVRFYVILGYFMHQIADSSFIILFMIRTN